MENIQAGEKRLQTTIYLSILFGYSLFEVFYHYNPIMEWLNAEGYIEVIQGQQMRAGVYRAQSLTTWNSAFGSACGLGMVLLLHFMFRELIHPSKIYYVLIICLAAGVIISGTRTVMVMTFIALFSILPLIHRKRKMFAAIMLLTTITAFVFSDVVLGVTNSIINHESAEGSSIEMRKMQYAVAYFFFEQSPWIGHGLGYVNQAASIDKDLLGAESIAFSVLIDRGLLGASTLLILVLQSLYVLIKRRCYFTCFMIAAFAFAKVMSLLPGQPETLILFYVIPLMKEEQYLKYIIKQNRNANKHHHLPQRIQLRSHFTSLRSANRT